MCMCVCVFVCMCVCVCVCVCVCGATLIEAHQQQLYYVSVLYAIVRVS